MLLVVLISLCALRRIDGEITVTVVPQEMCVLKKDVEVVFSCIIQPYSVDYAESKINWFFQDEIINFDNETVLVSGVKIKKYKEIQNELSIRNIIRRDEGRYRCQVDFEISEVENSGELTVGCLDENPFVKCDMSLSTPTPSRPTGRNNTRRIGGHILQVNISCKAFIGNNVLVNITIINFAKHNTAPAFLVYTHVEEQSDAKLGVSISHATDAIGLDGRQFWCVADHPKMKHPVNCSTPSLIRPKVKINRSASNTHFECKVESYPPITSYRWKLCRNSREEEKKPEKNNQDEDCEILSSTSSNLNLANKGGIKDVFVLICEVENVVGTGRGNLAIVYNIENRNKTNSNSSLVKWCIGAATLLLIVLVVSLYFGKRSRWGTCVKSKKKAEIFEEVKVSNAYMPDISHLPQITTDMSSLYVNPLKSKKRCGSIAYHSQSENQKIPPVYFTLENKKK